MFYAAIEADTGDLLGVRLPDGRSGGKASLSFLVGLSGYCSNRNDPDLEWFEGLEGRTDGHLCTVAVPLIYSFYSGHWDYEEDEYQFFLQRSPDLQITEDQFRVILRQVREKWADLPSLIEATRQLARLLESAHPAASPWYEPVHTVKDLEALAATLEVARDRGANRARIKFS